MEISLTPDEVKTLKFYLERAIIDAEGMAAIGVSNRSTVQNLKSIKKKLMKLSTSDKKKK